MIKTITFGDNVKLFGGQRLNFLKENKVPYKYILLIGENGVGKTNLLNLFYYIQIDKQKCNSQVKEALTDNKNLMHWYSDTGYYLPVTHWQLFSNKNIIYIPSFGILNSNTYQNYENDSEYNNWPKLRNLLVELCEKDRENGNTKQITMFNDLVNSFLSNEKIYLKYTYKSPNPKTQNSNIYTAYTFWANEDKNIDLQFVSSGQQKALYWATILHNFNENKENDNTIHLVDEPENDWHPELQKEFANKFVKDTKKQVIIATHSPFIVESFLKYHKDETLLIWLQKNNNKIDITYMLNNDKIVLPTISLAEINYVVYKIISADYHSMLYGYLSSLLTEKDNRMLITDFDKKIISLMGNNPTLKNDPFHKKDVSLPTYIRNCIDHPENKQRVIYTDDELTKSIEILRKIIEQIKKDSN